MLDILQAALPRYGFKLTNTQLSQFERYLLLLQQWNPRVNLVSDASTETVERRHFLESIALGAALREREVLRPGARVLDVGAGAGFPGIPMKIVWPEIHITLLEATAKKTAFLSAVVTDAQLGDTEVVTARAEDAGHEPALREQFDLVLARAVAPLPVLLELTVPFARVGGRVVTPKGSRADDEAAAAASALEKLHSKLFVVPFDVPGPPQKLIVAVKQRPTPDEYPRRSGIPSKRPL